MFAERTGFIIWVSDLKAARNLDKYGTVHYISRRMHYVVMYVNADRADDTMKNVKRLSYVRKSSVPTGTKSRRSMQAKRQIKRVITDCDLRCRA